MVELIGVLALVGHRQVSLIVPSFRLPGALRGLGGPAEHNSGAIGIGAAAARRAPAASHCSAAAIGTPPAALPGATHCEHRGGSHEEYKYVFQDRALVQSSVPTLSAYLHCEMHCDI